MELTSLNIVLQKGLEEVVREKEFEFIAELKLRMKQLFENTKDVETIKKEMFEVLTSFELNNFRRF